MSQALTSLDVLLLKKQQQRSALEQAMQAKVLHIQQLRGQALQSQKRMEDLQQQQQAALSNGVSAAQMQHWRLSMQMQLAEQQAFAQQLQEAQQAYQSMQQQYVRAERETKAYEQRRDVLNKHEDKRLDAVAETEIQDQFVARKYET